MPRTVRKAFGHDGGTIPWINYSTANVNFYYFYCLDEEFGPFFIKFCSYFPYPVKLCLNGHEWLKRQLAQRGLALGGQLLGRAIGRFMGSAALEQVAGQEATAARLRRRLALGAVRHRDQEAMLVDAEPRTADSRVQTRDEPHRLGDDLRRRPRPVVRLLPIGGDHQRRRRLGAGRGPQLA